MWETECWFSRGMGVRLGATLAQRQGSPPYRTAGMCLLSIRS